MDKTNDESDMKGKTKCKPLIVVGFADAMDLKRPPLEFALLQSECGKKFVGVSIGDAKAGMPLEPFMEGLSMFLHEVLTSMTEGPTKEQMEYLEEVKKKLVRRK